MEAIILDRNCIRLKLDYCESCIHQIKALIPVRHRTWDSRESVWFIDTHCLDTLLSILRNCASTEHVALVDLRLLDGYQKLKEAV